jgi:DNA-binding MarR family transcriptional regulator/GNAT superfamily N-acetyltransferase
MPESDVEKKISAIRDFNRFYTAHVGALDEHLLDSPFTLTEARVLYELGQHAGPTAAEVARDLRLDPAYLSRILRRFIQAGHVRRAPSPDDRRGSILSLTGQGQWVFRGLDNASRERIGSIFAPLPASARDALVTAMATIRTVLTPDQETVTAPIVIRPHRMGDISWVIHRQTVLYRDEYGWGIKFEELIAEIAAEFLKSHDPACEHCWVAERAGAIVGSVFLVRAGDQLAKLRLLYVEPDARGAGIGGLLVDECMRFARATGYLRMTLWTNDVLTAARRIYETRGFKLISEAPHSDFGPAMVGQVFECEL